jgi:hypothetical protein
MPLMTCVRVDDSMLVAPEEDLMKIEPIETSSAHSSAPVAAASAMIDVQAADAPRTIGERIAASLVVASGDLERAIDLATRPPRPSFHGHSPAETAAGLLAIASAHLADALELIARERDQLPPQLAEHIAQAIGSTVEAREMIHELMRTGTTDTAHLQPVAVLATTALAHTRSGTAVAIGEP